MKVLLYSCLLIILSISSTALFSSEEDVPELETRTTERGLDRAKFCSENAKKRVEELNQMSLREIEKAKTLQKELNEALAKRNIIKSFLDLKNDYQKSVANIREASAKDELAKIEDFKRLLNSALVMEALKLSISPYDSMAADDSKKADIVAMCESIKVSSKAAEFTDFCDYMTKWKITLNASDLERAGINKVLTEFRKAQTYLSSNDQTQVKKSFEAIYKSVPAIANPQKMLSTLIKSGLAATLNNSQKTLSDCLSNDLNSCRTLMKDKRDDVKTFFKTKLSSFQKEVANLELDKAFSVYDKIEENEKSRIKIEGNETLKRALLMAKNEKATLKNFSINESTINSLEESCAAQTPEAKEKCGQLSGELSEFFKAQYEDLSKKIETNSTELNSLAKTDGALSRIEKMKNYVAQKYLRKCSDSSQENVASNLNTCLLGGDLSAIDPSANPELISLNKKLSDVISNIASANGVSKISGENGTFSKQELESYLNYCRETSSRDFRDICRDAQKEFDSIKNKREAKDWKELSDKYWIVPSEKNPHGYEIYDKKSNVLIFGEALGQSIGRSYPIWLNNMNLKYQINTFENQALYTKQMNYLYTQSSPWNLGFPYFQGTYYNFPTSTYASPFTSGGFNFTN
jgi:hypothetical protein